MEILYSIDNITEYIGDRRAIFFIDENLNSLYPKFLDGIERRILPVGESVKTFEIYRDTLNFLLEKNFNRKDLLISFGGGVVSDLVGFVASTYMRGLDFFSIPTSLLAMVDASIGGKCGINLEQAKNMVGSFYSPKKIFIDKKFLQTLPKEEYNNGMAEIIKVALINDKGLVEMLLNDCRIEEIIDRAIKNKLEIVKRDYEDQGVRHLLNFGHTIAHAIEARSCYRERHGFSVAKGMYFITKWAVKTHRSDETCLIILEKLLKKYNLDYMTNTQGLWEYVLRDKKIEGDHIREIYPLSLGKGVIEEINLLKYKEILEI